MSSRKLPSQPIGVFDSGVGGLAALDVLRKKFPGEDFVYFGDTANMPYGNRSAAELYEPIHQAFNWLFNVKRVKFIVVACNTARSALAQWGELDDILKPHKKPDMIGPVGPVCCWISQSSFRRVGVLATTRTVASNIYPHTMARFSHEVTLIQQASKNLAQQIEQNVSFEDPVVLESLKNDLAPLLSQNIEALVLGCTHYSHIESVLRSLIPDAIVLLDPANHIADALWTHLDVQELLNLRETDGSLSYYVSGDPDAFLATAQHLPLKSLQITRVSCWK